MPAKTQTDALRVLFLSIVPSPYQRDLFQALAAREGIRLEVRYAEAASPDSPWPKEALAPYERVQDSRYISFAGSRFILTRELPAVDAYDAVVLNGYVTISAQWVLRTKRGKVPLLFWGEKMEPPRRGLRGFLQSVVSGPVRGVSAIVAVGKHAARDYRMRYPAIPVHELPYYCRLDNFQRDIPERPRAPVTILFCGQMIRRKGVDVLLEAFATLVGEGHDVRLLLVGREAELPHMLAGLGAGVRDRIEYAGFQSPQALPQFFVRGDIFVLPSRYDGWGVVVNQALGAGLPVVCSDAVGSAEDLVEPMGNGFIFRSGDAGELARHLRHLAQSPQTLAAFARRSLEKSRGILPEQGACDWEGILRETIERHHARLVG